jgi:hypothetical protein
LWPRCETAFAADLARHNRLLALGWTVLRFTADDVLYHPERLVAQVRAALAAPQRVSCRLWLINRRAPGHKRQLTLRGERQREL